QVRRDVADGVRDAICGVDGDAVRIDDRVAQAVVVVGNDAAVAGGEIEGDNRIVELVNDEYPIAGAVDHDVDPFLETVIGENAAITGRQVHHDDRVQAVIHDEGSLAR